MFDSMIRFYDKNVKTHGNDIRSVAWGSRESQEKRFLVFSEMADLESKKVLDVGCGLGDFYAWLMSRLKAVDYSGVDITPSMIEAASKCYPEVPFKIQNINEIEKAEPTYDFVFASGIFNRKVPDHEAFVLETIKGMFSLCKSGIAFNILSTRADFFEEEEYYANPEKMLDFCMGLSRKVILRHDYMPHDFTVYIYKGDFQ